MSIPFPSCLALFSSTLLFLSCVSVPIPDARGVQTAFDGLEEMTCTVSEKPVRVPLAATMSSTRFILPRSEVRPTDVADTMSARLSATSTMQAFSDVSDLIADSIAVDSASGNVRWLGSAPDATPKKLSACDLKEFLEIFREDALSLATYIGNPDPGTPKTPSLIWIFKKYFAAWIDGRFVDRNGRKYSEPHLKDKIPNDVIAAPLAIFLEALFDLMLNFPILVDGDENDPIYYPAGNKNRPTAATLQLNNLPVIPIVRIVPDVTQCGITRRKAKAIGFGSKLAASGSAMYSGLMLESFGDVEVALVIGGNYSIGDNETLATLVKTMFEVASRRVTERVMYNRLYTYRTPVEGEPITEHQQAIESFLSDFESPARDG